MLNMHSHNRTSKNGKQHRLPVIVFFAGLMAAGYVSAKSVDNAPSAETRVEQPVSLDTLVTQAKTEFAIGTDAKAIALLNRAAKENPTSTVPWLILSDYWFKAENYSSAIVNANEVLKREPQNQEAKSVLVMAGLRIASRAAIGLVPQSPVNTGVRAEAENLTLKIGNSLGEKELAAAPVPVAKPLPSKHHNRHAYKEAPVAVSKTANNASGNEADPFRALK
jgi:outer membrane protein assembly factor BamD (BamD/ComL family)